MKKTLIGLLLALSLATGCAKNASQTPQYTAAVAVNDFALALEGAQNLEISLHQTSVVPDDIHKTCQQVFLQAAQLGEQANSAVKAGNFTNAQQYFQSAISALNGLTPQMVNIKNPDSQKAFALALQTAVNIAQQWVTALGSPSTTAALKAGGVQ